MGVTGALAKPSSPFEGVAPRQAPEKPTGHAYTIFVCICCLFSFFSGYFGPVGGTPNLFGQPKPLFVFGGDGGDWHEHAPRLGALR